MEGNNEAKTEFAQRKITIKKFKKDLLYYCFSVAPFSSVTTLRLRLRELPQPAPFVVLIVEMQLLDSNFFVVFQLRSERREIILISLVLPEVMFSFSSVISIVGQPFLLFLHFLFFFF